MAISQLSITVGNKGKALPHAHYITASAKYRHKRNEIQAIEHINMPSWASDDPLYFWRCADEYERANGSTYREHIVSIPREIDLDQRQKFILDWIKKGIMNEHNYVCSYAIHSVRASDGGENVHAHIMFCERELDGIERNPEQFFKRYNAKNPEKGGTKKCNTGLSPAEREKQILDTRKTYENFVNAHQEIENKIDMRNSQERQAPTPYNTPFHQAKKQKERDEIIQQHLKDNENLIRNAILKEQERLELERQRQEQLERQRQEQLELERQRQEQERKRQQQQRQQQNAPRFRM